MKYSPDCYVLAQKSLPSQAKEHVRQELAQHIQNSIEQWLANRVLELAHGIATNRIKKPN